jgi:hypothetical protein
MNIPTAVKASTKRASACLFLLRTQAAYRACSTGHKEDVT